MELRLGWSRSWSGAHGRGEWVRAEESAVSRLWVQLYTGWP